MGWGFGFVALWVVGRGWLRRRYGFWAGGWLSLVVNGLGFWVGWLRKSMGKLGWGFRPIVGLFLGWWLLRRQPMMTTGNPQHSSLPFNLSFVEGCGFSFYLQFFGFLICWRMWWIFYWRLLVVAVVWLLDGGLALSWVFLLILF